MLVVNSSNDSIHSQLFSQIIDYCEPGDCLVLNNTQVIPARLYGHKPSGGKIECLIERIDPNTPNQAWAHIKSSRSPKPGSQLILDDTITVEVIDRAENLFHIDFGQHRVLDMLHTHGHIPLPPYIQRPDTKDDRERYQTVFAKQPGAVAAPTAGLHFDQAMLGQLAAKGVNICFITLHVGAGTFAPVKVDILDQHILHREWLEVTEATCQQWQATKQAGKRVIAIGTTSVRALESAYAHNQLTAAYQGDTQLFIRPGYEFKTIDSLLTNFHLPKSTLLMLVSALASHSLMMRAYQQAIKERFRFYSYGDAMLITNSQ